jgi:hypothetical protein
MISVTVVVFVLVLVALVFGACGSRASASVVDKHVVVYYEPGRFVQGVANRGIWSWGNEIMVGASGGAYLYKGPSVHGIDRSQPRQELQGRSLDGGETWSVERPVDEGSIDFHSQAADCPGDMDFTHPDFALNLLLNESGDGPPRFYYSYDRGRTWKGPFKLPSFDTPGVLAARTSYLVNGKHDCMLFVTVPGATGKGGRPLCARTVDGGKRWEFVSFIGAGPEASGIMPVAVRLSESEILAAVRSRGISSYLSRDNGETWEHVNDPVSDTGQQGNPPALIKLSDGRLCLTYGVRSEPYRMCAKLSSDRGQTWSDEFVLRDDAANWQVGYSRSAQRPDGKVVTAYYIIDPKLGPEPCVAATIWDPGK